MRNLQKKLLKDSNFAIYNASAGSGKTYSLTKKYLQLLLSGNSSTRFKRMLAITFTNKAVGEMKSRILDSLFTFSQPDILKNESDMFKELCMEIALSPQQMQKRCAYILKQILHNYAFFEISTIDKFNHKLIKTFARDLKLSQNFEVELNMDILLDKAISNLLERTGENKDLTRALLDFSLEKIEENKSWNIVYDLMESGKLLFQENHFSHLEGLKGNSIADFKKTQSQIGSHIAKLEKEIVGMAELVLKRIEALGFLPEDFPRKTLPNHFKRIAEGEHTPKALYNNKLEENLIQGKVLKANDPRDASGLTSFLFEYFISIKKAIYNRGFLKNIYSNIVPLTVLNEISREIKRLEEENDTIPISALNQLISKEIKNQPVPFIYERLGEKYRHYFIDEFQDTSKMQWENLVPLISNALEGQGEQERQGSLFLVGDVKQAIYRWRGGNTEQFLNLLDSQGNPFVINPQIAQLDTNWRSFSEIINFNNAFFSFSANILKNDSYRDLFLKSCVQKTNGSSGGYVNISIIENTSEEKDKQYCNRVLDIVLDLISNGYNYQDLCILVRDNIKGALLANYLSERNIPIISSDSLLLSQNTIVIFLISLLRAIDNPKDKNYSYEVLSFLFDLKKAGHKHDFIADHIDSLSTLLSDEYGLVLEALSNKSVFEVLEHAILQFGLSEGSEAYITFLMDEVLEVERKNGPSISAFIEHWEHKKESLSVAAPDSIDAVKIMTIHKSKGLEFPVVIYPFANSKLNDKRKKIWANSEGLDLNLNLENVLMNVTADMQMYPENVQKAYLEEEHKTQMDAMNVLYVALTRAEKVLYIVTEKVKPALALENISSYAQLLQYYLQEKNLYDEEKYEYGFGELPEPSDTVLAQSHRDYNIPYITRPLLDDDFSIATIQGQLWGTEVGEAIELGNLIHYALSKITYQEDMSVVLEQLELEAVFQTYDFEKVSKYIEETVAHPLITPYFSKKYTIYNEQEILTSDGQKLRPDKIALLENEAVVIDFKTGNPSPKHNAQIAKYSEVLKLMGFSVKNTIIVYIGEEIQPLFL
ncbi:UvrD-helicase domain-containing protein [Flagellimonas sp. S174]|uniref:UvrD-helicase domain-containing protein n=1 Tax=Flagellimonas sp. S174 TaxID=3410790 RepID=UPI003BF5A087